MNATSDEITVGDLVRLDEFSGTKAQQAVTWKVTAINPPTARRECSVTIQPVEGGPSMRARRAQLIPVGESGAVVQTVDYSPEITHTVVVRDEYLSRLRGYTPGTVLVVLGVKPGTVKAGVLNSSTGRYWASLPIVMLRRATREELSAHFEQMGF